MSLFAGLDLPRKYCMALLKAYQIEMLANLESQFPLLHSLPCLSSNWDRWVDDQSYPLFLKGQPSLQLKICYPDVCISFVFTIFPGISIVKFTSLLGPLENADLEMST